MDVIEWERNVRLIGELCIELSRIGVKVRLTDTRPALFVCRADGELERVEVQSEGECFGWDGGRHQHVVTDPKGAASRIAAFVRQAVPPALAPESGCELGVREPDVAPHRQAQE